MEVLFLYHPVHHDLFAYFPTESMCYSHVGEHSYCSIAYAEQCRKAEFSEYEDLLEELKYYAGYSNLIILN